LRFLRRYSLTLARLPQDFISHQRRPLSFVVSMKSHRQLSLAHSLMSIFLEVNSLAADSAIGHSGQSKSDLAH